MLELGIAALVFAFVVRIVAGLARFVFGLLVVVGVVLVALGLLGIDPLALIGSWSSRVPLP